MLEGNWSNCMGLMNDFIEGRSPVRGDSFLFLNEYRTSIISVNSEKIYTLEEVETGERKVTIELHDYQNFDDFLVSLRYLTIDGWKKYYVGRDDANTDLLISDYKKSLKGEMGKRKLKILKVLLGL